MTNPFKGEARLGEARLQLDVNAVCAVEETGETFEAVARKAEGGSMIAMRKMTWALMLRHQPDATLQEAGDLITEHGPEEVGAVVGRLFSAQASGEEEAPGNGGAPGRKPRRKAG